MGCPIHTLIVEHIWSFCLPMVYYSMTTTLALDLGPLALAFTTGFDLGLGNRIYETNANSTLPSLCVCFLRSSRTMLDATAGRLQSGSRDIAR